MLCVAGLIAKRGGTLFVTSWPFMRTIIWPPRFSQVQPAGFFHVKALCFSQVQPLDFFHAKSLGFSQVTPRHWVQITDLGPKGWPDLNDWSSTWTCWDNFGMLGGPSSASNS